MKKALISVITATTLVGCASYYDYYAGNVRYTQDGSDCIYYATDNARHYTDDVAAIDMDKKIVYKNTSCRDLYAMDHAGNIPMPQRKVMTVAAKPAVESSECCATKAVLKRRYVIVPAM